MNLLNKLVKNCFFHGNDFKHYNLVSHQYRFIYFFLPKVASTSIKKYCLDLIEIDIKQADIGEAVHQLKMPSITRKELKVYAPYYKFCFVRNPWDRLVSCYSNKISRDPNYSQGDFEKGVHAHFLKYSNLFWANMSFEEFVNNVVLIPDQKAEPHFRSQYFNLIDKNGRLILDFIGKFENLNSDFSFICEKIGIPKRPLSNLMQSTHENYQSMYTNKIKDLVAKRYKKDIEYFSFEF